MTTPKKIIIADDEASMRKNIRELLSDEGFGILEAEDGESAIELARVSSPDVVLLDINLPRVDGLSVLQVIKKLSPDSPIVVFTAYGTSERAIEAMKLGAFDYLEKPFELDEFLLIIRRAISYADAMKELRDLRGRIDPRGVQWDGKQMVGTSGRMQEIFKVIGKVAPADATVLIQGESGTGKELIADAIQRHSTRREKPFIKVNCGALPETLLESEMFGHEKGAFTGAIARREGRFELANGGTIFLDEINNMPAALQMKLLRVLQQKTFERVGGRETLTVDIRIIAATNKDIEREMKDGRFREDLFYRLNVIHVKVPPLREHAEDIPFLVEHFLRRYSPARSHIVSPDAMRKLQAYSWMGNVRELENVIQRACVIAQGEVITVDHLPLTLRAEGDLVPKEMLWQEGVPLKKIIADVEKHLILKALQETNWNRSRAAEVLHIHRRQLFSKIKQYRIDALEPGKSPKQK
ncbi:MAG: sigma-54-dependent Fis family transcriptional regulator [Ignavibacteria bacterium]|nr:sigma-54-dependent Fis family transcriptional regulator [Ignavibacteria bacterium]